MCIRDRYSAAADASHQIRGELAVGWFSTLAPLVMPELMQSFLKAYSETRIVCRENHQEGLLQSLRESETEVAITYDLQISDDIGFLPLATLPPYAIFAASHPLAHERYVKLSQLAPLPMVLLDLPISREYFLSLFIRERLEPNIASVSYTHLDVYKRQALRRTRRPSTRPRPSRGWTNTIRSMSVGSPRTAANCWPWRVTC